MTTTASAVAPSMIVARALTAGVRPKHTAEYSTIGQVLVVPTQAEVARAMGVSQARVSRMEHGDVDRMQVESIAAYVAAIGGHLRLVADFDQNTTTFIDYTDELTA